MLTAGALIPNSNFLSSVAMATHTLPTSVGLNDFLHHGGPGCEWSFAPRDGWARPHPNHHIFISG